MLVHQSRASWVAVKELKLSYYIGETLLFTIYTHYGNLTATQQGDSASDTRGSAPAVVEAVLIKGQRVLSSLETTRVWPAALVE